MSNTVTDEGDDKQSSFWLQYLPVVVLDHVGSFLHGDDGLAFGECFLNGVLSSEWRFWKKLKW